MNDTYYDRPLLKGPHWGSNVVTYLFLGGIMGGLGLIQTIAGSEKTPEAIRLRRDARYASFALAVVCPPILISHLGRPERFLNMLRILKWRSPMSLGVWGLVAYTGAAGANVMRELADEGTLPRWMRHLAPKVLNPVQALLGAFIAGYTGVLISATAIPLWGKGKTHIPAASVCSSASGACALSSLLSTLGGNHTVTRKLERLEMVAALGELAILRHFRTHAGPVGAPLFEGERGERFENYTVVAGIIAPTILNLIGQVVNLPKPVDAVRTILASTLTLAGAYVFRESLIEAGKLSANDPKAAHRQPQ